MREANKRWKWRPAWINCRLSGRDPETSMTTKYYRTGSVSLTVFSLMSFLVFVVSAFDETQEDARIISARAQILVSSNRNVTNRICVAIKQLKSNERATRLKGASDLFLCSILDLDRMRHEKVGDQIVSAYMKNEALECKLAMLATLDMLGHPALTNMLVELERSEDPRLRNIGTLIREKRYLDPVVTGAPRSLKVEADKVRAPAGSDRER